MTKFLFATQPSNDLGLLAQSIPIAGELRARGHQISFCTSGKAPCRAISNAKFKNHRPGWPLYLYLSGDIRLVNLLKLPLSMRLIRDLKIFCWFLKHMRANSTSEIWNIDHFMYIMGMCNVVYIQTVVNAFSEIIIRHKPDVVVSFWNPYINIAAKINNTPVISVIQSDIHPKSKGFKWWQEPPKDLPTPIPEVNKVMTANNLPAVQSVGELFIGDLTLVLGIPETDPLPDVKDQNYIGTLLLQHQKEELPDWISNLRKDQPVIWLYPGNPQYVKGRDSPFDGKVILESCIQVLGNMNVQVVLSTGHHALPKDVLPLPSNFKFTSFVPGLAMAERCDLMIHHGGYGSSQAGLFAGTPALIIPTYSERESNARRVAAVGAGEFIVPSADVTGKMKMIDTNELKVKIELLLSNQTYQENARKISEKLKSFDGASRAANLIENFIQS